MAGQARGPGTGKTTLCHNLARLLARVDSSWSPAIVVEPGARQLDASNVSSNNSGSGEGDAAALDCEGEWNGSSQSDMQQTVVTCFLEGDARLPFQYRLLVRSEILVVFERIHF